MAEDAGELLVGVTHRPDGSLDFSSALRMSKEPEISDPIVDRLRGPLAIDEDKEKRYKTFQDEMVKKSDAGEIGTWLINTLNGLKRKDSPNISPEDVASLKFVTDETEIQEIRKQYGYEFARPYFQLSLGDFKRVYEKLTGKLDSNGCVIQGGSLENNPLTAKIGIILAPSLGPEIIHELGHSIDPNFGKRSPQEEFLEELPVYYRETYIPKIFIQSTTTTDKSGHTSEPVVTRKEVYQNSRKIKATLKDNLYANKYASSFKSVEEYNKRIDQTFDIIDQLEKHMSKKDINKAIYNAKSFYELSHLLEIIKRENPI